MDPEGWRTRAARGGRPLPFFANAPVLTHRGVTAAPLQSPTHFSRDGGARVPSELAGRRIPVDPSATLSSVQGRASILPEK